MKLHYDGTKMRKELRTKRIMQQEADVRFVAKEIGISAATYCRIENGAEPSVGTFANICHWLEVDMRSFFKSNKSSKK